MRACREYLRNNPGVALFSVTLVLHLIVVVLLNTGVVTVPANASDHLSYHAEATQIAHLIRSGQYVWNAVYAHHWYPLFVGLIYAITGSSMVIGASTNAVLAAFSVVLLYRLMRKEGIEERLSFWAAFVAVNCYASMMYLSSILLKESWILFLSLVILWAGKTLAERFEAKGFSWKLFLLALACFIVLRNIRHFVAIAAVLGVLAFWFLVPTTRRLKKITYGIVMAVAFFAATLALTGDGIGKSVSIFQYFDPSYIYQTRLQYFEGGTTTLHVPVVTETNARFSFSVKGITVALGEVLFGPFPGQISLRRYLFALPDLLYWYPVFVLGCIGVIYSRRRQIVPYAVFGCVVLLGVAVGADNVGAYLRYRMPAFVVCSIIAALGWSAVVRWRAKQKTIGTPA